jgi:hypothetical protein
MSRYPLPDRSKATTFTADAPTSMPSCKLELLLKSPTSEEAIQLKPFRSVLALQDMMKELQPELDEKFSAPVSWLTASTFEGQLAIFC